MPGRTEPPGRTGPQPAEPQLAEPQPAEPQPAEPQSAAPSGATGTAARSPLPPYLRPSALAAVAAGGAVGSVARYLLELRWPAAAGAWPVTTFGINAAGALLLGVLLAASAGAGAETGRRRLIRLGAGTGALGSFTTYSTLAVDVDLLASGGDPVTAATYAVGTVVAGVIAAAVGIAIGTGLPAARVPARFRSGRRAPR